MAYYITGGLDQLPDSSKQHASSAPLQGMDFFNRLRANQDMLDDLEVHSALEAAAVDADAEHLACEAEIKALELRLGALLHIRPALELRSDAFKSLKLKSKAPIWNIPDDVLLSIFEMACTDSSLMIYLGDLRKRPRTPQHAIAIASVCSKWRALAIDESVLWTRLHIVCTESPRLRVGELQAQLRYLDVIFQRSKLRYLQITTGEHDLGEISPVFQTKEMWIPVVEFLVDHLTTRCQSLTVLGGLAPLTEPRRPEQVYAMLHTLRIRGYLLGREWMGDASTIFPVLQHVEVAGEYYWQMSSWGLAWKRITTLYARNWDIATIYQVLPQCINLQELRLSGIQQSEEIVFVSPESISLPALRHLFLSSGPDRRHREQEDHDVLRSLHIPALQSLDLPACDVSFVNDPALRGRTDPPFAFHSGTFLQDLTAKLHLPAYALKFLVISVRASHLRQLRTLVKECPGLQTFSLCLAMRFRELDVNWARRDVLELETTFLQMTAKADEAKSILLPSLKEFALDLWIDSSPASDSQKLFRTLVAMARSRHNPALTNVSRLQFLRLICRDWEGSKELDDELKEQGHDSRLRHGVRSSRTPQRGSSQDSILSNTVK